MSMKHPSFKDDELRTVTADILGLLNHCYYYTAAGIEHEDAFPTSTTNTSDKISP